ncbi:terpene synthase [Streptomyces sp. NPDC094448]|uniref:terpene synthase family protein n=1 Tax=Streptomyces sp. NPDC094448 TaxID=3366063 RepID=UPI0038156020
MRSQPQPRFPMPFPSRLNPHLDRARTRAGAWAHRMGMFDPEYGARPGRWSERTFEQADFPLFIALTHPDAEADELDLVTAWHLALWFLDDLFLPLHRHDHASDVAQVDRLMTFLPLDGFTRLPRPGTPVERAFAELWPRTAATMGPAWRERFIGSVRSFLDGMLWELAHVDHAVTDLVEYLGARRDFGGLRFTAVLMEHANGELHPGLLCDREVRTAVDAFVDAVSLHNDIVSYDRERGEGTVGNNGVEVARRSLGLGLADATALVNDLLTARVNTLARAGAAVPPGARPFVASLQEALAGSYRWHERTGRFRQPPDRVPAPAWGAPQGLGTSAVRLFQHAPRN